MKLKYLAIGVLFASGLMAQTVSPEKFTPTEIQGLRLQIKQKDAQLAQQDMQNATVRFQQALAALQSEGERVKTENKWDKEVVFNPNNLEFAKPPVVTNNKPVPKP